MLENVGSRFGVGPVRLERFSSQATPAQPTNITTSNEGIRIRLLVAQQMSRARRTQSPCLGQPSSCDRKRRHHGGVARMHRGNAAFYLTACVNILSACVIRRANVSKGIVRRLRLSRRHFDVSVALSNAQTRLRGRGGSVQHLPVLQRELGPVPRAYNRTVF